MILMKVNLFINNKEIEADSYTELKDPGRFDDVVGYVADGNANHVDQAVQAAYQAFLSWRKTPLKEKISLILQSANMIENAKSELAEITAKENGMLVDRTKGEIAMGIAGMRNLADLAETAFDPQQMEDEAGWVTVEKRPMGVIAGIVPWNAPLVLTMQKIAPTLLAGNTIVIKPSPFATMGVTTLLKKISGLFPSGVINIVHGDAEVGSALTTHPIVRKISFTGGGQTAKMVMKSAAETLKGIHLELGGNDPAIVLDDADIEEVVPKIVEGTFRRTGQFCFAIKRVYVPRSIYEDFYKKVVEVTDAYTIGHQLNKNVTMGPLNNRQQYTNVNALIERMEKNGANMVKLGKVLEPNDWDKGYYIQPRVVRDVQKDAEVVTCEQFGPILPLIPYDSVEEVIKLANDSEYGLGSSIWSSDSERALHVAREIEAGLTFINGHGQTPLGLKYMPFGGVKQSGIGRENSTVVFDEFIEYQGINYHK
ncbi:aldehyde dehydrogenase family protein [Salibacterium aidingense]|uniref:aldehyde dehydrogenase family protein n=1 Tax=Salibacterium aidingense TaxID=384933 RepID=UPI003BEA4E4D